MFPNTAPMVAGPSAPYTDPTTQALTNPTAATQPGYDLPGLSMQQMMATGPYAQYQKAMQGMQQQQKNMQAHGVGSMNQPPGLPAGVMPGGGGIGTGGGGVFGPFPQGAPPPQGGGF